MKKRIIYALMNVIVVIASPLYAAEDVTITYEDHCRAMIIRQAKQPPLKEGDAFPVTPYNKWPKHIAEADGKLVQQHSTEEHLKGKTAFAAFPGINTFTCSTKHIPLFIQDLLSPDSLLRKAKIKVGLISCDAPEKLGQFLISLGAESLLNERDPYLFYVPDPKYVLLQRLGAGALEWSDRLGLIGHRMMFGVQDGVVIGASSEKVNTDTCMTDIRTVLGFKWKATA